MFLVAGWLEKTAETLISQGKPEAYCRYCKCHVRAQRHDLADHAKSAKHKQAASAFPSNRGSNQSTLPFHGTCPLSSLLLFSMVQSTKESQLQRFFFLFLNFSILGFRSKSVESKTLDLKLAAHIACHSSVKTVDHLGELLKQVTKGCGTLLEELRLHRTKCGKLISKVLAPVMLSEIIEDVGQEFYSIIIDASTDQTNIKYMAVLVKYFSYATEKMIVDFLGLFLLTRATADLVYEGFKEFMTAVGLSLSKLFALGTDGGLELCGANDSLFALLGRNECPNLVLVKCICHGLDNCASTAAKKFPSTLEYLLRESRGWFSHSSIRKHQYQHLYMVNFLLILTNIVLQDHLAGRLAQRGVAWRAAASHGECGGMAGGRAGWTARWSCILFTAEHESPFTLYQHLFLFSCFVAESD